MTVPHEKAPSFERRATALTIAALAAVVEISVLLLGWEFVALEVQIWAGPVNQTGHPTGPILWFLPLFLFFGAMIAIPLCLTIGLPLWHLAVRTGRQSRRDAIRIGLAAGAVIGGFAVVLFLNGGSEASLAMALRLLLLFCVAGMSAGWIAHRIGYC